MIAFVRTCGRLAESALARSAVVAVGLTLSQAAVSFAALINPADITGSFGSDPAGWGNGPNTIATTRSLTPWTRPLYDVTAAAARATYQEWDVFTVVGLGMNNFPNTPGVIPNPPRVEDAEWNPSGVAALQEITGVSFATGGGNIYSPTTITEFALTIPNYGLGNGFNTNYLLQFRTQGDTINFNTLLINGQAVSGLPDYSYQEVFNVALGGFGGTLRDHKIEFRLPGNAAVDTLNWSAAASSLSLDKVSLDTVATAVPEPATWLTLAAVGALAGFFFWKRERQTAGGR